MTTYFAWYREGEAFSPQHHSRCDLDILALTIDHREGEVALATVVIAKAKLPPWDQRQVYISDEGTLLFSGRLVGLPAKVDDDLVSLELTSEPTDAAAQLQHLGHDLKQAPFWDPAFVEHEEIDNPTEWLEARSALFAWDRLQGTVKLSDLFHGQHVLDLTDVYFADSLKVSLAETPLCEVSVILTAEWIQQGSGEISLGGKIAAAFPGGMINTLTANALQVSWPKEGQRIGRSGFWVLKSQLRQITPPKTGVLNMYPTCTPELMAWDESIQGPKIHRARRYWMKGDLVLGWRYRQKRREAVRFTLTHKTQLDGTIRPLRRTLHLRLQEIPSSQDSTFFLTFRGRQTIEHALEMARAHLAASARCLEVEITLPLESGYKLSMDHSVRIVDPRIPGGEVVGKVIAYQFHQDGVRAYTWVRLAASIGTLEDRFLPLPQRVYVDPDYGDTAIPYYHQTMSGLKYEDYSHQQPQGGIIDLKTLSLHDILKEVLVSYDAEKQIQVLQNQQYPIRHNLKSVLEDVPTAISLNLLSMKTQGVAEHLIHLKTIGAWTAPRQVNLSGGFA